ncbi:MAG: DUF6318 family protein [Actinomycetes bacterium]
MSVPPMPEAAKQHTVAGGEAFVKYYIDVINAVRAGADPSNLRRLSTNGCSSCEGEIQRGQTDERLRALSIESPATSAKSPLLVVAVLGKVGASASQTYETALAWESQEGWKLAAVRRAGSAE